MSSPRAHPAPQRAHDADHVAAALREGALAVFPTETLVGVGVRADIKQDQNPLFAAATSPISALTWHAPSRTQATAICQPTSPLHRRIFEKLLPGPFRLVLPFADAIAAALKAPSGVLDHEGALALRVPEHKVARELLERAETPIAVIRASAAGFESDTTLPDASTVEHVLGPTAALLHAPEPTHAAPSTSVKLTPQGGYEIIAEGAIPAQQVHDRIAYTILFICTGNTCRSPMAEAIARDMLDRRRIALPTRVLSAGVAAHPFAPITPEARASLTARSIAPPTDGSTPLTPDLLSDADIIFTMTESHRLHAASIAPEHAHKVHRLHTEDIPDPIGGPPDLYDHTADELTKRIAHRLDQFLPEEHAT